MSKYLPSLTVILVIAAGVATGEFLFQKGAEFVNGEGAA